MKVDASTWRRPVPTLRQQRWDVASGALLTLAALVSLLLSRSAGVDVGQARPSPAEEVAWVLAVALPLWARRRLPLSVLIVCSVAFIGLQARFVGESTMTSACLFVALYTAGAWAQDRRIALAVRTIVVVAMFCWLVYSISATAWSDVTQPTERHPTTGPLSPHLANILYIALINVLFFAGAWYFGDAAWSRARQDDELHRRTEELRAERDENARRAVFAERVRIARELHDVVAHHVSVMGVQAGAARRVLDDDPELARAILTGIEDAGRVAVTEMQRLLVVLREGDADLRDVAGFSSTPAPSVESLPQLFESATTPGLSTAYTVVGEPRPLSAALSVSLYRMAQEALTNTIRHAGASAVDARLRYLQDSVELEVVDNGRGSSSATAGSGLGQVGMRERISLHGGQLDLGARPSGGYRVRARFPLAAAEPAVST